MKPPAKLFESTVQLNDSNVSVNTSSDYATLLPDVRQAAHSAVVTLTGAADRLAALKDRPRSPMTFTVTVTQDVDSTATPTA